MSFLESPRFTDSIAKGATGGPNYLTEVVELSSGVEHVDSKWVYPRHRYNISTGIRLITQIEAVQSFFHVVKGRFTPFRFKDWADYKSTDTLSQISSSDQQIGVGDSTDGIDGTASFQLIKTYETGASSQQRLIQKPVAGSTLIEVDGTPKTAGLEYNIDTTTGITTFTTGNHPLTGEVVKSGYLFDVPVRFETDGMSTSLPLYQQGVVDLMLIEVKIQS